MLKTFLAWLNSLRNLMQWRQQSPDAHLMQHNTEDLSEPLSLEATIEFAENPEPRCPCVLLLDVSAGMQGEAINALNQGLEIFKQELNRDNLAKKRVEVAVVTFSSEVEVVQFVAVDEFEPPKLTAQGQAHMGTAIVQGLEMLAARKAQYRAHGVTYFRPWFFLMTNGEPQGEKDGVLEQAIQRLEEEEANQQLKFYAVSMVAQNRTRLSEIVKREPLKLEGLNFQELFVWLSASMQKISYNAQ